MGLNSYHFITSNPGLSFLYRFIRAYSWTFRLAVENEKPWMEHLQSGGTVLLCVWHQQFFSAIRHFQNYRKFDPSLMISQSKDGEIIAGVAERSGWRAVRGSSSHGGAAALKEMIQQLRASRLASHIVDGPRGPAGVVKAGAVRIAHVANAVVVPFYTTADKAWYFNSRDRFFLPKPFSKVSLRFGDMIEFERVKDSERFEQQQQYLEDVMRPALIP